MSAPDHLQHWDSVYRTREPDAVSWFQAESTVTLELVELLGIPDHG
ncbi:MAG: SAM-dependent methyltransferase, partial [Thermoleophilia bacterium]|nr:SAM-dependent methyltransferase [Thermoleophilia bacterium]